MFFPNPNPGRPPLGGQWQFVHNGITLTAPDFPTLAGRAMEHLAAALLTRDEIEQKILAQEKVRCPWLVRENAQLLVVSPGQIVFREYIRRLTAEYHDEPGVASSRSEACAKCPHNQPCALDEEAARMLFMLTRGEPKSGLGFCDHYRQHNAVAVLLDNEPDENAPPGCWRNIKLYHAEKGE